MYRLCFSLICLCLTAITHAADPAPTFTPDAIEFFEKKIRPLLVESCHECHAAAGKKIKGELRLDSRAAMIAGGESGSALTPGDPGKSRLIEAVTYKNADLQMPPKKKLSDQAIADLKQWVKMGAPWPVEEITTGPAPTKPAIDFEARKRDHWAWQPVKKVTPPVVKNERWVRNDIDRFILAKLEASKLSPSNEADRRALIRRLTFDLTGLPPTAKEVENFLADNADKAYETLVDRLLASPQFGERMARQWLDVVRYADSKDARGIGGESDIPFAYRYRDWVINAFNRDLPYDQFIMQQIAGDIMIQSSKLQVPGSKLGEPLNRPQAGSATWNLEPGTSNSFAPLIATTMLAIGNWDTGDSDKRKMMSDIVDDQVDVITRGFLGMTVACARCHDHKFDPISTRDYYALAGFFFSSHIIPAPGDPTAGSPMLRIPLMDEARLAAVQAAKTKADELRKQINEAIDIRRREVITRELGRIKQYLAAAAELDASETREAAGTLSTIAARHGVHASVLKRFVRYLGMAGAGGTVQGMFTTKLTDVVKSPLVMGWGEPQTPSVLAHVGTQPIKLLTFTLPPRSIAMHPSPTKQVAIGWRSKMSGIVSITGLAADADDACGNGFNWSIVHRHGSITTRLASGGKDNAGRQTFTQSDEGRRLEAVQVQPGDLISLIIDAKGKDHICDSTTIEFIIREAAGAKREWNVTTDVVDSILASNPHADRHGNRDIWHFYAISENADASDANVPAGSLLAKWLDQSTASNRDSNPSSAKDIAALAQAVHDLANSGDKPPATLGAADVMLHRDLISANSPLWSTIDLLAYSEVDAAPLDVLKADLAAQTKLAATKIEFAQGIREGGVPGSEHAGVRDAKVHIRGRYDRLGEVVPRGYPALIAATPQAAVDAGSSGRKELAKWIASPDNRMTARVMVNRIWQQHMGRGIVATPDNFGHLGSPPSHPQLLDYLATQFVEQGWSIKAMHKLIVMSATYRQASGVRSSVSRVPSPQSGDAKPTPETRHPTPEETDPENLLLWRQNRHRLDAEQLRDALLAVAGQLDRSPTLTPGPGTVDLLSPRRSIYLMAIRSDRSTYRTLFDAADPTASIHVRNESTVAPQALFMLNHPFALTMAKGLAQRVLREAPAEDEKKIAWMYEQLFSRTATPREIEIGQRILREAASGDPMIAWMQYCQVLLCANEFVYVD